MITRFLHADRKTTLLFALSLLHSRDLHLLIDVLLPLMLEDEHR